MNKLPTQHNTRLSRQISNTSEGNATTIYWIPTCRPDDTCRFLTIVFHLVYLRPYLFPA